MTCARLAAICALSALSGCARLLGRGAEAPESVPAASPSGEARVESALFMPPAIATEDDYVVRIVVGAVTCSGSLIAEDRVLTAHHCVASRSSRFARNVAPERIHIELGGDYLPWGEVGVRAVIAPSCGFVGGDGDVAVLVLERPLTGIATRKPRLDDPPGAHEGLEPIGFGRCALSSDGIHRKHRLGAAVDNIGYGRFRMSAPICPGDSGGPAVSINTGEIVGVVSASAMDGDEGSPDRSEFVRTDRWRPLFANAELVAHGTPEAELPPVECTR